VTDEARKIRLLMRLREAGIHDTAVLSAIEKVPRELFVAAGFEDQAYEDRALPIDCGQTISQPRIVAAMTQALAVAPSHTVLEIGTGSGYQAAVLARLCRRLYTVERHADLLRAATARFAALGLHRIVTRLGDGAKGWPEQAPFDRILVTAAAEEIPAPLIAQLHPDGVLVLPVGRDGRNQTLMRVRRKEDGYVSEEMFPVRFVPLLPGRPAAPKAAAGD
jgi:protein-L-isoaspartate(D-aspartate) O-methyltransferase